MASGYVVFHRANRGKVNWLKALELWSDCECRVLEEPDFPRVHVLTGYFLSSSEKPSEQILQVLQILQEGQNEDLDTGNVKVLNRTEEKPCLALTLEVDQTSFERLSRPNFQIEFGFGLKVKLNPRKKESDKKSDPKGPPKQVVQPPAENQPSRSL
jgi:Domain of unknown function (DUF4780)